MRPCGGKHDLCHLTLGTFILGRTYQFICPETRAACLYHHRPESAPSVSVGVIPAGSVVLEDIP